MSEPHRETLPGGPECWCLQCLFKRMDTKSVPQRATELYEARGLEPAPPAREPASGKTGPGPA